METKENTTAAHPVTRLITIMRSFNLPLNKVWKAWSEPASLKKWWGPEGFTCPVCRIDFKTGGKYLACMKSPEGKEYWSAGVYIEIIPQEKIIFSDSFSDSKGRIVPPSYYDMPGEWPPSTKVTVTLKRENGKTKIVLEHQGIPSEIQSDCLDGWDQAFDKMEKNLK